MRFLSASVFSLFLLSFTPVLAAFSDIQGHPNEEAILYVKKQGIVQGYNDGTYKPNATINRAEFTKIIIEALYDDAKIAECASDGDPLIDVILGSWYQQYVCVAQNEGIIGGYPDRTFRPANTINYAEAAKILVLAYGIEAEETDGAWYEQYTQALVKAGGALNPEPKPDALLTRGQMAQLIYNLSGENDQPQEQTSGDTAGSYVMYQEGMIGNGEPAILFFHAGWCPKCKTHDELLTKLYSENDYKISVLKVDYDSASDLKTQYGVLQQHTYVVVDGYGEKIDSAAYPTDDELEGMLTADY